MKSIKDIYLRDYSRIRILVDCNSIIDSILISAADQINYRYEIHILNNKLYRLIKYNNIRMITSEVTIA